MRLVWCGFTRGIWICIWGCAPRLWVLLWNCLEITYKIGVRLHLSLRPLGLSAATGWCWSLLLRLSGDLASFGTTSTIRPVSMIGCLFIMGKQTTWGSIRRLRNTNCTWDSIKRTLVIPVKMLSWRCCYGLSKCLSIRCWNSLLLFLGGTQLMIWGGMRYRLWRHWLQRNCHLGSLRSFRLSLFGLRCASTSGLLLASSRLLVFFFLTTLLSLP